MTKFDKALDHAIDVIGEWEYKNYIHAVYLYGSCARGDWKQDSDIDLYILLEKSIPFSAIRDLKVYCNSDDWKLPEVDVKVDLHKDALNQNDLFHRNIREDGVLLWKRE